MSTTSGGFGGPNAAKQCTAMSKRSGKQCQGPAVLGSPNQRCRMHGGFSITIGTDNAAFRHGRSSKYLPSQLGSLYDEALSNPDLLEMASHIALLEARMHEILGESTSDSPVPKWSDLQEAAQRVGRATKLPEGPDREKQLSEAAEAMEKVVSAGAAWDTTWGQVIGIMDQIRKMTDTEVKRKKELNQMVPVERVLVLMMALGDTVKRCVTDPVIIQRIQGEFAKLVGSDKTLMASGGEIRDRVPPTMIDISAESRGVKGGGSDRSKAKAKAKREQEQEQAEV